MISQRLAILLLLLWLSPGAAIALEFMPYPVAKISHEEWQAFYIKAGEQLSHSRRVYPEQDMVIFIDTFNGHHYAFTLPGHDAHPSCIVRRITNHDGEISIQQVGYYVDNEKGFVNLFKSYLELNSRIKPELQERNQYSK